METLNVLLQLLLVIAVFLYFLGFVAPSLRWQLWRWAAMLVATAFAVAVAVVEARIHPIAAFVVLLGASFAAYGIVEARRAHQRAGHRHTAPTFLNLRVTGKTPVETDESAPLPRHDHEEDR
jgi:hypothetical protein